MPSGRIVHGDPDWSRFYNCRRVQVVGRYYHQPGLQAASQGLVTGMSRWECTAELRREPDNPHDENAIRVLIDGHMVGYVKRGSARRLNTRLRKLEEANTPVTCPAFIRHDGARLQAHLQIPYDSELIAGWKNTKRPRQ